MIDSVEEEYAILKRDSSEGEKLQLIARTGKNWYMYGVSVPIQDLEESQILVRADSIPQLLERNLD